MVVVTVFVMLMAMFTVMVLMTVTMLGLVVVPAVFRVGTLQGFRNLLFRFHNFLLASAGSVT